MPLLIVSGGLSLFAKQLKLHILLFEMKKLTFPDQYCQRFHFKKEDIRNSVEFKSSVQLQ